VADHPVIEAAKPLFDDFAVGFDPVSEFHVALSQPRGQKDVAAYTAPSEARSFD
jgi:hypothetical protein